MPQSVRKTLIENVRLEELPLSQDAEAKQLLQQWEWFFVHPEGRRKDWEADLLWARRTIVAAAEVLCAQGLDAWISLYGPFEPEGLIGATYEMAADEREPRFYMAPVSNNTSGPGFVESFFNIEWGVTYFERLFGPLPGAPGGVLPCVCHVAVMCTPHEESKVCTFRISSSWLWAKGSRLREDVRAALSQCRFLILPNLDVDSLTCGFRKEDGDALLEMVKRSWSEV